MKPKFAEKWNERLLVLQAQMQREPTSAQLWHWRAEARVLRFLLQRYSECGPPDDAATADVAAGSGAQLSPLERALLRMALVIPSVHIKHPRPAPCERQAILARIERACDEGRDADASNKSWLAEINVYLESSAYESAKSRRHALRLRERKWQDRGKRRRE